jgi:hypothetical protein
MSVIFPQSQHAVAEYMASKNRALYLIAGKIAAGSATSFSLPLFSFETKHNDIILLVFIFNAKNTSTVKAR